MKLNFTSRNFRLMPAVIMVGASLFVMKASGLVRQAEAAEAGTPSAAQSAPVDFAGPSEASASPSEVDILTTLSKRRDEMDARSRDLDMRANLLAATEKRVDDKIAQLKSLQSQLADLLKQRDAAQDAQIQSLVKTYSDKKMQAAAARIFVTLDDDVLIPVAQTMKPDVLAVIMSQMPPDAAQKLTLKLANKLTLPKAAPVTPPAMAPEAAVPGQQSDATTPETPPLQKQAALTPPPVETPAATPATKPVQLAAKAPAAAPVKTPAAVPVKASTPATAAKTDVKTPVKADVKADAKPDPKADVAAAQADAAAAQAAPVAPQASIH